MFLRKPQARTRNKLGCCGIWLNGAVCCLGIIRRELTGVLDKISEFTAKTLKNSLILPIC